MKTLNSTSVSRKQRIHISLYLHDCTKRTTLFLILLTVTLLFNVQLTYSIPSFARQTGMPCSSCHMVFPQLTTFGREFKLNGYTLAGTTTIDAKNDNDNDLLKILAISPLSAMVQTSFTHINNKISDTQNDNIAFPQQLSLFYSGIITPHIGTFIQITYSGESGTIEMDNIDIRYSNTTTLANKRLVYGFTLNNNPTLQDVWNSIPAWSFPYATSEIAPAPATSPLIEGALAQQVIGLGAYVFFNSFVYAEYSIYRSAQQGVPALPGPASTGIIKGVAPYWRIALQHNWDNHYLEIGTTGLVTDIYPEGVSGTTDRYTDIGFDAQYRFTFPQGTFVFHPLYYREFQKLNSTYESGGSQNISNYLNSFKISGELYFDKGFGATLGYFHLNGSNDQALFQPSPIDGNRTGSPKSDGLIAQLNYLPWYNVRLSLQYIKYNRFNGTDDNYDGSGRNASDNNTIYLLAWFNF